MTYILSRRVAQQQMTPGALSTRWTWALHAACAWSPSPVWSGRRSHRWWCSSTTGEGWQHSTPPMEDRMTTSNWQEDSNLIGSFEWPKHDRCQICCSTHFLHCVLGYIPNLAKLLLAETRLLISFRPTPRFCWCLHFWHGCIEPFLVLSIFVHPFAHWHQPLTSTNAGVPARTRIAWSLRKVGTNATQNRVTSAVDKICQNEADGVRPDLVIWKSQILVLQMS